MSGQPTSLLEQLKRDIERFKSPRLRLIESGQLELVTKPFIEIIKDNITDREAKAQIDMLANNEEFKRALLELITIVWLSKLIDSGKQVGNRVETFDFKLYKIMRRGWLIQCIPLDGSCPNNVIDFIIEVIRANKDKQEIHSVIIETVKELASSNEEFKKKITEVLQ